MHPFLLTFFSCVTKNCPGEGPGEEGERRDVQGGGGSQLYCEFGWIVCVLRTSLKWSYHLCH